MKKILHVCLFSHYTAEATYQDNMLAEQNAKDGYEVTVISDNLYYMSGRLEAANNEFEIINGVALHRLTPLTKIFERFCRRVGLFKGLWRRIKLVKPDLILHHGVNGFSLLIVALYCKFNAATLVCDNHADNNNSATTWFSKYFLWKGLYRFLFKSSKSKIKAVLQVAPETENFFLNNIDKKFSPNIDFPLGGIIIGDSEKIAIKKELKRKLCLSQDTILCAHSGKFNRAKRTLELIEFFNNSSRDIHLLVIGNPEGSIRSEFDLMINGVNSARVTFIPWVAGDELREMMAASDLYLQPGTQSASLQTAICSKTAVVCYPHTNYKKLLGNTLLPFEGMQDLEFLIDELESNRSLINSYQKLQFEACRDKVSYSGLAKIIYSFL